MLPLPHSHFKAGQMVEGAGLFGLPYFAVLFTDEHEVITCSMVKLAPEMTE